MNIKNAKNWSTVPRYQAYLISMAITLVAFGARYLLQHDLEPYVPFQMFVVASLIIEYLVGLGPAILSATLGLLLGMHFFIAPYGVIDGISRSDVIVTVNYVFGTFFTIGLIEYLRRTLYSNQLLLKVSQSRHKISLYRENDRLYLARKTANAVRMLEKLFSEFDKVLLFKPVDDILYAMPRLYQLTGASSEALGADGLALFHPDDRVLLKDELAQLKQSGSGRREMQLRLACGSREYQTVKLSLEHIAVDGIHASVLKLVEAEEVVAPATTTAPA